MRFPRERPRPLDATSLTRRHKSVEAGHYRVAKWLVYGCAERGDPDSLSSPVITSLTRKIRRDMVRLLGTLSAACILSALSISAHSQSTPTAKGRAGDRIGGRPNLQGI